MLEYDFRIFDTIHFPVEQETRNEKRLSSTQNTELLLLCCSVQVYIVLTRSFPFLPYKKQDLGE